ncbi:MAG: ADP-ribosylglycohydrolase family protein [Betaproteobacteria bacterium]|nr:ADP-ribosylglycohydrolase family protein [Betaproteobacteria bacterium]
MLGSLLGDIVGSAYKSEPVRTTEFELFPQNAHYSDETVLTLAIAHAVIRVEGYQFHLRQFAKDNADVPGGFSTNFKFWVFTGGSEPYHSMGQGPATRVAAVGWAFEDLATTLREAEKSARATHDHPEAIKGAVAMAHAIYLGRTGGHLLEMKKTIAEHYGYNLDGSIDELRYQNLSDATAPVSVPLALLAVLEARTTEDAIRSAVSLGWNSDALGCMAGALGEAFYGVPDPLKKEVLKRLPEKFLNIMAHFREFQSAHAA